MTTRQKIINEIKRLKLIKRHCSNCGKDFYCNNKCGRASTFTICFCKWCCEKLHDKNYNYYRFGCKHYKSPYGDEERIVFT